MASTLYQEGLRRILSEGVLLSTNAIKVLLIGTGYTPNNNHQFISDVANELTGTGYAAGFGGSGRKTLASKAFNKNDTSDFAAFDAADVTWTAINAGTAKGALLVKEVTTDADSPIICFVEFPATIATNGGDFTIQWHADGIFKITT